MIVLVFTYRNPAGINVVRSRYFLDGRQFDATDVVWLNVDVSVLLATHLVVDWQIGD